MNILVTGAGGFIGSHVARALAERGHEVKGMDNGFTATHLVLTGVQMATGDVTEFGSVYNHGCDSDVIVHFAGLLGTHEIAELGQTNLANTVNINGTVNVLDVCRTTGATLVFATKPNPRAWLNPYTITKQAAEDYCQMYATEYGVNTVALSLMWIYGKEQRQEPVNKFIPTFMRYALNNEPIPIWNTGNQVIDCCYVDDVVEAFVRAVEAQHLRGFVRIDVGTGKPITVREVAEKVIRLTGSTSGLKFVGKRLGEPMESNIVADTRAISELLGFVPSIGIDEGLELCIDWFQRRHDAD